MRNAGLKSYVKLVGIAIIILGLWLAIVDAIIHFVDAICKIGVP